ncbi:MAG: ABC transporter permease, partial [Ilumatobacteraceae bacterium]
YATSSVRGRTSWPSLLVGALMVAGMTGSTVVAMSLTEIVEHPARWGVDYQTLFGNPYIYAEGDIIQPIADVPDVEAVTGVNIGSVTIDGFETATISFDQVKGAIGPIVIDGRLPRATGEIGIGAEAQRRIGSGIGDTVQVAGTDGGPRPFTIVGTVVTPDSAGDGAAMTFDAFAELNPTATKNVALVDFRDGAPDSAITRVSDITYSPPDALITPTSVRALERVTAAPYLLALAFLFLAVIGCAYLLAASARSRRREFSILRALGSDRRQLRAIVHWHATVVGVVVLAIGLPVGIVGGRSIVFLLTDALGIVPGAHVSLLVIGGVVAAALAGANVLAMLPALRAASNRVTRLSPDGQ